MKFPNGFGTVYKLSGHRRKPWIARMTVGWTTVINKKTGKEVPKQLYETIGYFEEKTEAIDALTIYRVSPVIPKADITFEELYNEWSKIKFEEEISHQTIDNYKAGWKHLSKYKKVLFRDLRTSHLQTVINECRIKGLSKSTLKKIKIVASMMYDYAIDNDIVDKNYAKKIKIKKEEKTEKEAFTDLEIKKIEDKIDIVEWADVIIVLIYTGLRITELLDLTKFSIDLENQLIKGGIKTDAGKDRIVPIHPKISGTIQKWYNKNGERLICSADGKRISSRKFREDFYIPALKVIGVRELNPHSCRHTFATLLSKAGAETIHIQKIIGHANYSTTADIYTHPEIEELRKAINLI